MEMEILCPVLLAFGLYVNTLQADFVYDDSRAILKNPDILPEVPVSNLFLNDFWGTPLNHSGSHKSYRPLCVLSFRLNYLVGGFSPIGYHLGNAAIHAVVTGLFVVMTRTLLLGNRLLRQKANRRARVPLVSGLMFASHPVHTEAVAGVVGRADLLACFFFLLAFLSYVRYCGARRRTAISEDFSRSGAAIPQRRRKVFRCARSTGVLRPRREPYLSLFACALFTTAAMLSKEQGVTVIAVCATYDVFLNENLRPNQILQINRLRHRGLREGLLFLFALAVVLISMRIYVAGLRPPEFSPSDNPAADSDSSLTRTLTLWHLPCLNFLLLVFPQTLNFDWSMEAVRLVDALADVRNLCSVAFYASLSVASYRVTVSLNYSPATESSRENNGNHSVVRSSKDSDEEEEEEEEEDEMQRNLDEHPAASSNNHLQSTSTLSHSHPKNGTIFDFERVNDLQNNFAPNGCKRMTATRAFASNDRRNSKILLISLCLLVFPFIPATNLFFYVGFVIAERILYIPSMGYCLLVAHGVEILYIRCRNCTWKKLAVSITGIWLLATYSMRTVTRNMDWRTEEALYRSGIAINPAKAWGNLANVLYSKGRFKEAEEAHKTALNHRGNMADVHYNLGILYQEQGRFSEAIDSYRLAIQCRPRLTMAHLNLGIVLSAIGRKDEAKSIYRHCAEIDINGLKDPRLHEHTKVSALYNLGRLLADEENHQEAIDVYLEAVKRRPAYYQPQSLYNMLGESYAKLDQLEKAEGYYRLALKAKPDHLPAHLTMAKLHHRQGLIDSAEEWFKKGLLLDPTDPSVYHHYGQFLGDLGRHSESAEHFLTAAKLSPNDFEAVFGAANSLRQANMNLEAEKLYKEAVRLKPSMAIAHMNLGAMLHYNGKLKEAEVSYEMALHLKPNDVITMTNLDKLRNLFDKQKS